LSLRRAVATLAFAVPDAMLMNWLHSGLMACAATTFILRYNAAAGGGKKDKSKDQQILPNHRRTSIDEHKGVEEATGSLQNSDASVSSEIGFSAWKTLTIRKNLTIFMEG